MQSHIQSSHSRLITTDQIHNQNCYRFLKKLSLPTANRDLVPEFERVVYVQQSDYDQIDGSS